MGTTNMPPLAGLNPHIAANAPIPQMLYPTENGGEPVHLNSY